MEDTVDKDNERYLYDKAVMGHPTKSNIEITTNFGRFN